MKKLFLFGASSVFVLFLTVLFFSSTPTEQGIKALESKSTLVSEATIPSVAPIAEGPKVYSVVSVIDGDTLKISMNGKEETLRLIGIDTPETVDPRKTVQCFGKEASNKAKELLVGKRVRIEVDPTQGERDKYDRLLVYIHREDGLFYNKHMIEQGYAHEYTYNTPYIYQAEFKAAQARARTNQKGLWSPATCNGDTTSSPIVLTPPPTQSPAVAPTPAPTVSPVQEPASAPQSVGKYYTSSYGSSKYYYPEACGGWKSLSPKYLKSFDSLEALLATYSRTKSPQCQ